MKRFASLILAVAGVLSLSAAPKKVNISNFADMAPYVYPNNSSRNVPKPYFMPDGQNYLQLSADGKRIVKHDIRTGAEGETIMDVTHTRQSTISNIESFVLSPDGSKLLIATGVEPIYRHSTRATHYVYELRTRILTPLSEEHQPQRAPLFSPDGRMVAFVANDNNIYLKKLDYGTEVPVTTDGAVNSVINGVPDWVYEEEFSTSNSMAWAPDCMTLCYLKYNEADVPTYSFPSTKDPVSPNVSMHSIPAASLTNIPWPVSPTRKSRSTAMMWITARPKTSRFPAHPSNISPVSATPPS